MPDPKSNPVPPDPPVTGRTQWDAAVEIIKLMGVLGPLLLVLIAAGVGIYYFQQGQQEQLSQAHERLTRTYEQIGGLSDKMITNLQSLMTLHDDVNKKLETGRTKLDELELNAEKAKQSEKDAIEHAAKLASDAEASTHLKAEADGAWAKQKDAGEAMRKELDESKKKIEVEVKTRTDERQHFQKSLMNLNDLIQQRAEYEDLGEALAKDLRMFIDVERLLTDFATSPDKHSSEAFEGAVGVISLASLEEAIRKDSTWAGWEKCTRKSSGESSDSDFLIVGTLKYSEYAHEGVVALEFDASEELKNVRVLNRVFCIATRDSDDLSVVKWGVFSEYSLGENQFERSPSLKGFASPPQWSLKAFLSLDETGMKHEVLAGATRELPVIKPSELGIVFPDLRKAFAANEDTNALIELDKNIAEFDAKNLKGAALNTLPAELQEALFKALNGAVRGDDGLTRLVQQGRISLEKAGKMGAAVLKKDFRVIDVVRFDQPEVMQQTSQHAIRSSPPRWQIVAATHASRWSKGGERVVFEFEQRTPGADWELMDFRSEGLIDPEYDSNVSNKF